MSPELPPLPPPGLGDGVDWMDELRGGWYSVPLWGRDGWDLMEWPYAVAAHFDGDGLYGLATYTEGDIEIRLFDSRSERDAATDLLAAMFWRSNGRGPRDLQEADRDMAPHHRGPFSPKRAEGESR